MRREGEAPKIMYILRDKDIRLASKVFDIDEFSLRKLNDQRLLNVLYIRDMLVRYHYDRLTQGLSFKADKDKVYTKRQICRALMKEFKLSSKALDSILNGTNNKTMYFCNCCGMRITIYEHKKNGGLCSDCRGDMITID